MRKGRFCSVLDFKRMVGESKLDGFIATPINNSDSFFAVCD